MPLGGRLKQLQAVPLSFGVRKFMAIMKTVPFNESSIYKTDDEQCNGKLRPRILGCLCITYRKRQLSNVFVGDKAVKLNDLDVWLMQN